MRTRLLVRPEVQGIIEKSSFKQGSWVDKGQVFYQLDSAKYKAAYDNAQGTLTLQAGQSNANRYIKAARISAVSELDKDSAVVVLAQANVTVPADKASLETAKINLGCSSRSAIFPRPRRKLTSMTQSPNQPRRHDSTPRVFEQSGAVQVCQPA